jgi:cyclophilin family peptidyl-prolyl cis-trans isomerase
VRKLVPLLPLIVMSSIPAGADTPSLPDGLYAEITTERGLIVCSLEYQKAPLTVANFVGLAEGTLKANGAAGRRFYDGLTFHRVEKGFVIQGGDPKGDGSGGPGYEVPNETRPDLLFDAPGVLGMANAGPDTNGSQFYITMRAADWLDGGYSVFGHVVQGMDVVTAVKPGDHMTKVRILRVGPAAGAFTVTQKGFDADLKKAWAGVTDRKKNERVAILAAIQKKWPHLTTTKTGLMYEVLKKGTGGGSPAPTSRVTVNYTGMFLDGKIFDSTSGRGKPAVFQVNRVIAGWGEALVSMTRGEKRRLVIPPEIGYGAEGYPGAIPPNSFLVFEVELIDF